MAGSGETEDTPAQQAIIQAAAATPAVAKAAATAVSKTKTTTAAPTPEARLKAFLDLIGHTEGANYNTKYGGGTFSSFAAHPGDGPAGRYQFQAKTWAGLQSQLGLPNFSPASQDKGAIQLLREKGALGNVLAGEFQAAIKKLTPYTWSSLPGGSEPRATMSQALAYINQRLGKSNQPATYAEKLDQQRQSDISTAAQKKAADDKRKADEAVRKAAEALARARELQDKQTQQRNDSAKKTAEYSNTANLKKFDLQTAARQAEFTRPYRPGGNIQEPGYQLKIQQDDLDKQTYEKDRTRDRALLESRQNLGLKTLEFEQAKKTLQIEEQRLAVDIKSKKLTGDQKKYGDLAITRAKIKDLDTEIERTSYLAQLDQRKVLQDDAAGRKELDIKRKTLAAQIELNQAEEEAAKIARQIEEGKAQRSAVSNLQQELGSLQVSKLAADNEDKKSAALAKQLELQRLQFEYDQQRLELATQLYAALATGNDAQAASLAQQLALLGQINDGKIDAVNQKYDTLRQRIHGIADGISQAVSGGISSLFNDVISGTKSFGDAILGTLGGILKNISGMFLQMATEIAQKAIFKQATSLITGLLGGAAGGLGKIGGGGITGTSGGLFSLGSQGTSFTSILGFSSGGYTGGGSKYTPAGIVHKNEYVIRSEAVQQIGVARLNALNQMAGYADGGLVGGMANPIGRGARMPVRGEAGSGPGSMTANITLITPNYDSFRASERQIGQAFTDQVKRGMRRG